MKRIILIFLFTASCAHAGPDDLHTCLAWFTVYESNHSWDRKASMLKTELELEMKKDKIYNSNQIRQALNDKVSMLSATNQTRETETTLSYCTKISSDFSR